MVNVSIAHGLSECEQGSLYVGPRSEPSNKTEFTYAIISNYDDWFAKKRTPTCKESLETLYNGKNCVLLNVCVEYQVGQVWLMSKITKNGDGYDSFDLTFYKDRSCTQKWKEHTLKKFVPGECYRRPWGIDKSISIKLANECPRRVTYFGNLNDDDDAMSDDDDDAYNFDDVYDNDYTEGNDPSEFGKSSELSNVDQATVHPIFTVVVLLGLVSVGMIAIERRRRGVYTPIEQSSSTIQITTGNAMFELEAEEQSSNL